MAASRRKTTSFAMFFNMSLIIGLGHNLLSRPRQRVVNSPPKLHQRPRRPDKAATKSLISPALTVSL
jgi:hypothetical protein